MERHNYFGFQTVKKANNQISFQFSTFSGKTKTKTKT